MLRSTRQRRAIEETFVASDRPLSPSEVLNSAQARVPRLGIATVYRHIRDLLQEGWLKPVPLPFRNVRYECSGKRHHDHLLCRHCDRLLELDGCLVANMKAQRQGHRVDGHELLLYGVCRDCRPCENPTA